MVKTFLLAAGLAAAAAKVTVVCSIDQASLKASGCTGSCTTSPDPAKGANFTVTVVGNCPNDVKTATYDAHGTFAGIPVLNVKGNTGCGATDFPVGGSLNLGHMYIGGVTCPVTKSTTMTLSNHAYIAKLAPPGTLKSTLTVSDQDKKALFTVDLDVST